jgi:solute carrier family 25 protein 44
MPLPGDQDVDLPRLVAIVSAPYTLLTAACHPLNVMKTRAQASSSTSVSLSRMEQLRVMLGTGGMRGLFSGVGPVLLGAIPARCSYIAALEAIKVPAERAARAMGADGSVASGFAHGAGGFAAAFVSSLVYVPVDVVSQRMMLEGASGSLAQTVREVTSGPRGWRGLYRGLGISLMLGLPAGSLWWATYGSVRTALADEAPSSRGREFAHKAIASTAAAAVVVSVMSPLDMIKTRVQLLTDSAVCDSSPAHPTRRCRLTLFRLDATPGLPGRLEHDAHHNLRGNEGVLCAATWPVGTVHRTNWEFR